MKKILIPLALLAACSPDEAQESGGNQSAAAPSAPAAQKGSDGRIASLVGLYEGGQSEPKHQMCVTEGEGGEQRFGLVIWGGNMHSCSGSGTIRREGDRLRLVMAGDSTCTIEATITGNRVKLPASTPQGCAYYCGARATLAGAELTQTGTTKADAMRAKDLAGDPLCGAESG